jgi:hypothetical protein
MVLTYLFLLNRISIHLSIKNITYTMQKSTDFNNLNEKYYAKAL